ncbi:hypothetical protein GOB94_13835 [Granulicella sp. 5B5]|uniref:universal stress protein n=1 Tax=Granulicella sp. 5B5 TaxID=1617967 RepID=UPI0015F60BB9|nr:universal stress protein [Granulicella sp. 5B5]QMV19648.1 hypothetical protein GOB94_13835 [Granulicella sp. 5B5]
MQELCLHRRAREFQHILLATDFEPPSRSAFAAALVVCAQLGADLSVVHVTEAADIVPGSDADDEDIQLGLLAKRQALHDLSVAARQAGVAARTHLLPGIGPEGVLNAVRALRPDMVVMGTSAPRGLGRLAFGSTAESVLRNSPCPVLTVGPRAALRGAEALRQGPVVFATDFDTTTMPAIFYASVYSDAMRRPLHCFHVLPRMLEGASDDGAMQQVLSEALQQAAKTSGVAAVEPVCATEYGSEVSTTVVAYAEKQAASLIVLGMRQASMLSSHLRADVAVRVIVEAPCPVMTMAFAAKGGETPAFAGTLRAAL